MFLAHNVPCSAEMLTWILRQQVMPHAVILTPASGRVDIVNQVLGKLEPTEGAVVGMVVRHDLDCW